MIAIIYWHLLAEQSEWQMTAKSRLTQAQVTHMLHEYMTKQVCLLVLCKKHNGLTHAGHLQSCSMQDDGIPAM